MHSLFVCIANSTVAQEIINISSGETTSMTASMPIKSINQLWHPQKPFFPQVPPPNPATRQRVVHKALLPRILHTTLGITVKFHIWNLFSDREQRFNDFYSTIGMDPIEMELDLRFGCCVCWNVSTDGQIVILFYSFGMSDKNEATLTLWLWCRIIRTCALCFDTNNGNCNYCYNKDYLHFRGNFDRSKKINWLICWSTNGIFRGSLQSFYR